MTKAQYIEKYQNIITVYFDFEEVASNPAIELKDGIKNTEEFLQFYIPRYKKDGFWNNSHIQQIIEDTNSEIVQLKEVVGSPADWGLETFHNPEELSARLWPIPLATDSETGKTLILDSNHTICTLLAAGIQMNVPCVEIVGRNLSALGADLALMHP